MIYKVHLNTNFMESSYIILSEENVGGRSGANGKIETLYKKLCE